MQTDRFCPAIRHSGQVPASGLGHNSPREQLGGPVKHCRRIPIMAGSVQTLAVRCCGQPRIAGSRRTAVTAPPRTGGGCRTSPLGGFLRRAQRHGLGAAPAERAHTTAISVGRTVKMAASPVRNSAARRRFALKAPWSIVPSSETRSVGGDSVVRLRRVPALIRRIA